jgi:hypothetical protein
MNYEEMSDQQINEAVTCIMFQCKGWSISKNESFFYHCGVTGDEMYSQEIIDYCKCPSAWGWLIQDNKISCNWWVDEEGGNDDRWGASTGKKWENATHPTSPGRAVAICYLKMKEANNG